jgi:hypothetical protein
LVSTSQHADDLCLLHDQVFDAIELDLGSRLFAESHTIADVDVDGESELSSLAHATRACRRFS